MLKNRMIPSSSHALANLAGNHENEPISGNKPREQSCRAGAAGSYLHCVSRTLWALVKKKKKISCSRSAARPKKLYLKELLR